MCGEQGISIVTYAEIAKAAYFTGALIENQLAEMADRVSASNYDKDVKATLELYSPAFDMTLRESEAIALETGHLQGVNDVLRRACASGYGKHDFAAVYELFKSEKK